MLDDAVLLGRAGLGGGGLIYGHTLYEPKLDIFEHPAWTEMGGQKRLQPYDALVRRVLSMVRNLYLTKADETPKKTEDAVDGAHGFSLSPVAVYRGKPEGTPHRRILRWR